ncbi:hypothetical protein JCM5296_001451 [Sporobolomyces johnsonii]
MESNPPLESPSLPLASQLEATLSLEHRSPPPGPPPFESTALPSPSARPAAASTHPPTFLSTIESLPPELIERIGHAVCRLSPCGPPAGLGVLLLASRRFYDVLGPRNAGFYADLFKERFDYRSIERRWAVMRNIEEKREKLDLLGTLSEVKVKPSDEMQLNPSSSFTRPSSPSEFLPSPKSPWAPLTNRDYALELKRRCLVLTKMRLAVRDGSIPPTSSRPSSPRLQAFTPRRGTTKLSEPDELTQNLWTCYLMLIENDGKNLPHLLDYACLRTYMRLFYNHSLLAEALNPGWPRQTAGRALGLWIGWLGGDDLSTETAQESDERFFVLKPYVFAAHRFDSFLAPWTIPSLPVTHEAYPVLPPPVGPFLADLRPRSHAQNITHMGRKLDLSPPNLAHAAIFSFFFRVEQDPAVQNDLLGAAHGTPALHQLSAFNNLTAAGSSGGSNALGPSSRPTKTSHPTLSSRIHDRDFLRLASCVDPYSSRGLPTLYTRGDLSGNWEGRFSFFDFDSYRDMLGGRMRSLYEGPFGDQPQVWKLEERVVRLDAGQKPGGKGPALNAGYEIGQPGPRPTAIGHSQSSLGGGGGGGSLSQSPPAAQGRRRGSVGVVDGTADEERAKRQRRSGQHAETFWEDEGDADEHEELEDGDYEILLTGSGHSAWGQFILKGRVRSWDGMFTIIKEYTPDSRGRWIYRGYRVGDSLVGRWRDTHTPVDMSGYEGTWSMTRRM